MTPFLAGLGNPLNLAPGPGSGGKCGPDDLMLGSCSAIHLFISRQAARWLTSGGESQGHLKIEALWGPFHPRASRADLWQLWTLPFPGMQNGRLDVSQPGLLLPKGIWSIHFPLPSSLSQHFETPAWLCVLLALSGPASASLRYNPSALSHCTPTLPLHPEYLNLHSPQSCKHLSLGKFWLHLEEFCGEAIFCSLNIHGVPNLF